MTTTNARPQKCNDRSSKCAAPALSPILLLSVVYPSPLLLLPVSSPPPPFSSPHSSPFLSPPINPPTFSPPCSFPSHTPLFLSFSVPSPLLLLSFPLIPFRLTVSEVHAAVAPAAEHLVFRQERSVVCHPPRRSHWVSGPPPPRCQSCEPRVGSRLLALPRVAASCALSQRQRDNNARMLSGRLCEALR